MSFPNLGQCKAKCRPRGPNIEPPSGASKMDQYTQNFVLFNNVKLPSTDENVFGIIILKSVTFTKFHKIIRFL